MLEIPDGFMYNTLLRPNKTFLAQCMERYDALRGAVNFRSRAWVIPEDHRIAIPANDSYEFQVDVVPGSIIWAWTWVSAIACSFNVTDSCTDASFGSEMIATTISFGENPIYLAGVNPGNGLQNLLSKPLVVSLPGILNVVICNLAPEDTENSQLVLWGGEPIKEEKC